jgi:predicted ester cyclase
VHDLNPKEHLMDTADLHRRLFGAVAARDLDAIRTYYDPAAEFSGPDGSVGDVDAAMAYAGLYLTAFPDLAVEVVRQWAPCEEVSVVEYRARGTHLGDLAGIAPTGRSVTGVGCNVIEARDGKVVHEREYSDSLSVMQQLGVLS